MDSGRVVQKEGGLNVSLFLFHGLSTFNGFEERAITFSVGKAECILYIYKEWFTLSMATILPS